MVTHSLKNAHAILNYNFPSRGLVNRPQTIRQLQLWNRGAFIRTRINTPFCAFSNAVANIVGQFSEKRGREQSNPLYHSHETFQILTFDPWRCIKPLLKLRQIAWPDWLQLYYAIGEFKVGLNIIQCNIAHDCTVQEQWRRKTVEGVWPNRWSKWGMISWPWRQRMWLYCRN